MTDNGRRHWLHILEGAALLATAAALALAVAVIGGIWR